MSCLVAIVGPTATGKSQLAIRLAQRFNGEIVSADSRQVYRHMDIGTAKPSWKELSSVPHHLIDIIDPDEDFSLAQYQELANSSIKDIQRRSKLPFLVGGSGLYVWAVLGGWEIPRVPPDTELRRSLEERVVRDGGEQLYRELQRMDPVAAQGIDPRNVRRVIRALEVSQQAGAPFSRLRQKNPPPFDMLITGLTTDRAELYRRVDSRVDRMIERGLVEEVKRLVDMGYDFSLPSMSGIGYGQIGACLRGETTLETVIQKIKNETHRFVRHQYGWFRLSDKRIRWFDIGDGQTESRLAELIGEFVPG
jgi:tRNA dimethylallyltransferase